METQFGTISENILSIDSNADILDGNSGDDSLFGGNYDDSLNGDSGDDSLFGGYHDDVLDGDSGDDSLFGGYHDDSLNGDSGDDSLFGGYHDDVLDGDSGDDSLFGGYHDDSLDGDSGDDSLFGGNDHDTLTGGDGADRFVFSSLDSFDLITDFDSSEGDKIVFNSSTTGIIQVSDLIVNLSPNLDSSSESHMTTSLYFGDRKIIEFDSEVNFQVEDFEFF